MGAARAIPTILESPNGHPKFPPGLYEESARWCGASFHGHPTLAMVERVESEYRVAGRIRVSSEWSRRSMLSNGVTGKEIGMFEQPVNLSRFIPNESSPRTQGRLRVCYVGSLDLRKGFVYLLRAAKLLADKSSAPASIWKSSERPATHRAANYSSANRRDSTSDALPAIRSPPISAPTCSCSQLSKTARRLRSRKRWPAACR